MFRIAANLLQPRINQSKLQNQEVSHIDQSHARDHSVVCQTGVLEHKNSDLVRNKLLNIQSAMTLGRFFCQIKHWMKKTKTSRYRKITTFRSPGTDFDSRKRTRDASAPYKGTPASKRQVTSPNVLRKFKLQVPVPIFNYSLVLRPILKAAESRIDKLEPIQSS